MFALTPRLDRRLRQSDLLNELLDPFYSNYWQSLVPAQSNDRRIDHELVDSQIRNTDQGFLISLDVSSYQPDEIKISSDDHSITVQAKHEDKEHKHGYFSQEMKRVYKLPDDVDPKSATSNLNTNGVLSIKVAKRAVEEPKETAIPIEFKE